MSDDKRRETKPDLHKGKQTATPSRRGVEKAVDRGPTERAVERPVERKS